MTPADYDSLSKHEEQFLKEPVLSLARRRLLTNNECNEIELRRQKNEDSFS